MAWVARVITLPGDPGARHPAPAPLLRRELVLPAEPRQAWLHVTALGLHRVSINGQSVSEDLLAPGWTPYRQRLLHDTYDVTGLLTPGANAIAAALGDGWYRGRLGWSPGNDRANYGDQVALVAQLEVDLVDGSRTVIATDGSWLASTGEICSADLYDGAVVDLRERRAGWDRPGYDAAGWVAAAELPFDHSIIEPRIAPPVRRIAVLPVATAPAAGGRVTLDSGQNLAGFVRLSVRGRRGDTVTVRHAEVLEPDGSLHTRSLRSARATDVYVLADDSEVVLEPPFTFHGFRYAEVETEATVLRAEVVAISSDTPRRGRFECSEPALNRLHENVVWSQRGNFVSVPTDCPQRDERLGWTGDAQAFAPTACTLFDSESFWRSWLRDLDLEQDDRLGVPSVVPDVVLAGEMRYGRAGWADAATIVPWAVYESFGNRDVLEAQLESMRRWVDSLVARRGPDGFLPSSFQFGDWLDPDAPSDRPWEAKADPDYLAHAYFAHSASLLADAESLVGDPARAGRARSLAEDVAGRAWERWAGHAVSNQTGCAAALQLGIAPESERATVGRALAGLVRAADGRVATGFLGTPLVLPALAATGHFDEAFLMLLRREAPSWLYQVEQGATTVWERWDAIRPDGSIHDGRMAPNPVDPEGREGHMLSFNHYAYGAVIDWVYRHVAGIAPDRAEPGYRHVIVAPRPPGGLDWVRASVETVRGRVATEWRVEGDTLEIDVDVPEGSRATVRPPVTERSSVSLDGGWAAGELALSSGRHTVVVTAPAIADPRALRR
ncbi:MAG TPA: glycoside hydrolase family 78 protein [Candidatus Limnocylindrales bacterium]|nr:glycoside hydrolase family 78 protein [Candidatus Limnocylindrales bacterium]